MSYPELKPVSCKYGAPMGRSCSGRHPGDEKVYVREVRISSQGYDPGGAYWGIGNTLFHVTTSCGTFSEFIRAHHRDHAIEKLERDYEGIKFYRGASK